MSSKIDELNSASKQILIKIDLYDNYLVLILSGSIDTYNSNDISRAILGILEEKSPEGLIIDLGGVNYVASTGIGCMTLILKHCKSKNIKLHLAKINPKVLEVFSLLGFTSFFSIIENYDETSDINSVIYPIETECPNCRTRIKIPKTGRFKCKSCGSIIVADISGSISLGGYDESR